MSDLFALRSSEQEQIDVVPKLSVVKTPKTRYSDEELVEFRELIVAKIDKAKKDFALLKRTLSREDDNGTEDTSPSFKVLEEGATVLSREEVGKLAQRQAQFIRHLQAALVRIENKTYGICRQTGKLISKERLRAVPHATLSIEAKNGNDHNKNNGHRK